MLMASIYCTIANPDGIALVGLDAAASLSFFFFQAEDGIRDDLVTGVQTCALPIFFRGEAVCPPQLCSVLFRCVAQMSMEMPLADSPPKPDLTLRQQQLVTLVAKGLTNKEIASHLNLSEFTVRNHINNILKQVHASSRSEAVETIRAYGYSISS